MALDRNVTPKRDVPGWGETRWHGCWSPDEGVGLYMHMGRCQADLDLWWAQTVAYLSDGTLAVDRSWGRQDTDTTVRTGVFAVEQTANGWASRYDGAAQATTRDALTRAPQGSAATSVPMAWAIEAAPVTSQWDLYGGHSAGKQVFAGDTHVQQAFLTAGELTVAGETYRLDGVGYSDHSTGTRTWKEYGGHAFVIAVMPGWTMHLIVVRGRDGEDRATMGAMFRDGEQLAIVRAAVAPWAGALGELGEHRLEVEVASGEVVVLDLELLHELPISVTDDLDNMNGIDWEAATIAVQETAARVTLPDGTVGHAFFERGARLEDLERPRGLLSRPTQRTSETS